MARTNVRHGISLDVSYEMKETLKDYDRVRDKVIPIVTARALNHAGAKVLTKTKSALAKKVRLPAKSIKRRLKQTKATKYRQVTTMRFHPRPVSAASLKPRKTKTGVKAGKHKFPGAWIIEKGHRSPHRMRSHEGGGKVRAGGKRFPGGIVLRRRTYPTQKAAYKTKAMKITIRADGKRLLERYTKSLGPKFFADRFKHEMDRKMKVGRRG